MLHSPLALAKAELDFPRYQKRLNDPKEIKDTKYMIRSYYVPIFRVNMIMSVSILWLQYYLSSTLPTGDSRLIGHSYLSFLNNVIYYTSTANIIYINQYRTVSKSELRRTRRQFMEE